MLPDSPRTAMRFNPRPRSCWLLLSLCIASSLFTRPSLAQGAGTRPVPPAEIDVGLQAVSPAGNALKILSDAVVLRSLMLQDVRVRRGDDIKSLLRSNNIRPDAQALAFTAQLNPTVSHLDNLSVGARLVLPTVRRASVALSAADPSTRIAIITAPVERSEITRSVTELAAKLDELSGRSTIAPNVMASLRNTTKALARPELISSAPPVAIHNLADNVAATVALVEGAKAGVPQEAEGRTIAASAARLSASVTTLSACRESGASCMAQLTIFPLDAGTRKAVADVKLYYAPVLWRAIRTCAPPNGHPCRHDFFTNAPAYKVGLSQDGSFAVWAARGDKVVSCDLQIDPPIQSGEWTIDVYATAAERDAAGCAIPRVAVRIPANGERHVAATRNHP
jgi:hypothetical protein